MDAIAYVRRRRRVACMDWFLFFSFRVAPVWGRWGKLQQGTPYSLRECNKALLPNPHTGAGQLRW